MQLLRKLVFSHKMTCFSQSYLNMLKLLEAISTVAISIVFHTTVCIGFGGPKKVPERQAFLEKVNGTETTKPRRLESIFTKKQSSWRFPSSCTGISRHTRRCCVP